MDTINYNFRKLILTAGYFPGASRMQMHTKEHILFPLISASSQISTAERHHNVTHFDQNRRRAFISGSL